MNKESNISQMNLFDSTDVHVPEKLSVAVKISGTSKRKSSAVVVDMQLRRTQAQDKEFIRRTKAEVKSYDFA